MWLNNNGRSAGLLPGRELGPVFLMAVTPIFIFILWYTMYELEGDFAALIDNFKSNGWSYLGEIVPTPFDPTAWKVILSYMAVELAFMRVLPGKTFKATLTPAGNVPVYKANGMQAYFASLFLFFLLQQYGPEYGLHVSWVYHHMGELLSAMNVFSLAFCCFLLVKGLNFPSSTDSGSSGNWIIDLYWGTELYPRVLGFDLKMFTNCRFGMMFWALGILCYAQAQYEKDGFLSNAMFVSVALQLIYITKFFHWETGYLCSMDIQHDRAGYYICWGCLVWVPSVYTSPSYFLVNLVKHGERGDISSLKAIFILVAGIACIFINYWADRQRQVFRATNGKCTVWGKDPVYITASYTTEKGEKRSSLLLASGWWGVARHFHYVPEILGAFLWSYPAGFHGFRFLVAGYFYVLFLTPLLFDRAFRDDARCRDKYGKHWDKYCALVPYKIIPGIL